MTLLSRLPIFPIYYNGKTKFMPIHCSDLTDIIYYIISKNIYSKIIECIGPETISLKNILYKLLKLIDKNRFLIPFPLFLANYICKLFSIVSKTFINLRSINLFSNMTILTFRKISNKL